ncbi:MAG TPA: DUF4062 domain-containing protein [Bryobacteraceae bacterium]|nr:DUF4062 domain-containing protein [Bryobacteraceae bacterium]
MEQYRVFISSIMNRSVEDLIAEREVARRAVENFSPITQAWAFEAEPASSKPLLDFYLDAVKTCDLLVMILGAKITKPVLAEYETAIEYQRPVLAFFKGVSERESGVEELRAKLDAKWDGFENATELYEKIRRALGSEMLRLVRGEEIDANRPGDRLARLRALKGQNRFIRLTPMIPRFPHGQFRIEEVTATAVKLYKLSNSQEVTIPAPRIEDVLDNGADAEPTIVLNGRLQYLTLPRVWRFFPEKPPEDDQLGIGFGAMQPLEDRDLDPRIGDCGFVRAFAMRAELPYKRQRGFEVFFDDQGNHRVWGKLILLVRPKREGE